MSDPIDRAVEVITRAMFGLTTPSMPREVAYHLHAAGLLVTPAHDAAVAAKALREAADALDTEDDPLMERPVNDETVRIIRLLRERADEIEAGDE